jgi:hypothetical protein
MAGREVACTEALRQEALAMSREWKKSSITSTE